MTPLVFGPWVVESVVGEGTFAQVYCATHREHPERRAAVKVLREEWRGRNMFRERFADEARTIELVGEGASRVSSLTAYFGADTTAPIPWIAIEWINGCSLDEVIESGRLPDGGLIPRGAAGRTAFATRVIRDVASALAYSHRRGIVHRDIKPENILCSKDGRFVLIDFGIARDARGKRHTSEDLPSPMTPDYAAPELLASDVPEHLEAALDVYALGCTLYEIVVGSLPQITRTQGNGAHAGYISRTAPLVPPENVGLVVRRLVRWMTQVNGASRPSVGQIIAALDGAITIPDAGEDEAPVTPVWTRTGTLASSDPGGVPATASVHIPPPHQTGPMPSMSGGIRLPFADDGQRMAMPQPSAASSATVRPAQKPGYYPMQRPSLDDAPATRTEQALSDKPIREGVSTKQLLKIDSVADTSVTRHVVDVVLLLVAAIIVWYGLQQLSSPVYDEMLTNTALNATPAAPLGAQPAATGPALDGVLSIGSSPAGAAVTIDNHPVGKTPVQVRLPVGPHLVRFESDGLRPIFRVVDGGQRDQLSVDLNATAGHTEILVLAPGHVGVDVRIDGNNVGRAPLVTRVDPGAHVVELLTAGVPQRKDVFVRSGTNHRVEFVR